MISEGMRCFFTCIWGCINRWLIFQEWGLISLKCGFVTLKLSVVLFGWVSPSPKHISHFNAPWFLLSFLFFHHYHLSLLFYRLYFFFKYLIYISSCHCNNNNCSQADFFLTFSFCNFFKFITIVLLKIL